jgi:hypothetical protein
MYCMVRMLGMVASQFIQGLAARARGVGPPRTLPVVDDAVSALLLEGCGTSLPHACPRHPTPRTRQPHARMRTYVILTSLLKSCSIPSLSFFLLSVALHLGVVLAFIVDCGTLVLHHAPFKNALEIEFLSSLKQSPGGLPSPVVEHHAPYWARGTATTARDCR